jgi:HK97 family phage portal protein
MGILTALFEPRAVSPPPDPNHIGFPWLGGYSAAGVKISEEGSLHSTAVFAAVRVIAESIASLPLVVYRQSGRNKQRATDHPLFPVLHDLANEQMTAMEWRETVLGHVVLWGTAYSEIVYNGAGRVVGLWPLRPDRGIPIRENGQLWLKYQLPNSETVLLPWYRVFSIRGLGSDGMIGYSPIAMAMQAVGLTLAAERYGASFFGNGARPGGVLEHPGRLGAKASESLREQWTAMQGGLNNAQRVAILEEGMKFSAIGIPPEEAQFLETRKFQIAEIARMFRVPPHMLADLDRATFSNIEHQSLEFVIYTLRPWLVRFEQAIYRDLLQPGERRTFFAKHVIEGLLRGDTTSRYASYQSAINTGWMTRNEARELEDWNPLDGLDEALVPLNMVPSGAPLPPTPPARGEHLHLELSDDVSEPMALEVRKQEIGTKRQEAMRRMVRLWEDAAGRAVKREAADIRRAIPKMGKRGQEDFFAWLANFYADMRGWLPAYFEPLMQTYAEQMFADVSAELGDPVTVDEKALREWVTGYLDNMSTVWVVGNERQLRSLVLDAEDTQAATDALARRMDDWETTQPGKVGLSQSFEAGNALIVLGYATAGVGHLIWRARGESCPLCKKLDGRRIPIKGSFVKEGDTLSAEGVDPLPIVRQMRHGPLHGGCDCVVVAG